MVQLFRIKRTDYNSLDLITNIRYRLRLYRVDFEVWLWICSASTVILPMAIVFIPDSINGTYTIYNVPRFIMFESALFFGIYFMNKISVFKVISDLKAYYSDLIESTLLRTEGRENWIKKYRFYLIGFFVVVMIILVLFALKGLVLFKNF